MSKRQIVRLSIWGLAVMVPAGVLMPSSSVAFAARDGRAGDGYGRTMIALFLLGATFAVVGFVLAAIAWAQAVVKTRSLEDPRWFQALLWAGILGILSVPIFGIGLLVFAGVLTAYAVAGPEVPTAGARPTVPSKPRVVAWSNRALAVAGAGLLLALVVANLTNRGRPLHGVVWPSLALISLGITAIGIGAIILLAAWWGALFNAHLLVDKTWFNRLRWLGIAAVLTMPMLGLGAVVVAAGLIAYRVAAPDGTLGPPAYPPVESSESAKPRVSELR